MPAPSFGVRMMESDVTHALEVALPTGGRYSLLDHDIDEDLPLWVAARPPAAVPTILARRGALERGHRLLGLTTEGHGPRLGGAGHPQGRHGRRRDLGAGAEPHPLTEPVGGAASSVTSPARPHTPRSTLEVPSRR